MVETRKVNSPPVMGMLTMEKKQSEQNWTISKSEIQT